MALNSPEASHEDVCGMEKRVLIIDDDIDFQFMVGSMLRTSGYEVKTLLEGKLSAAVNMAGQCDIVILDVELPGTSGVDLGMELRSAPETSNIPIILVSGHADGNELFSQSKANAYIQKPFSLTALMNTIKALLKMVEKPV